MKKQILCALTALLATTPVLAEQQKSRLQFIETKSCENSELQRTIVDTTSRVLFDDKNLTVLEESLNITPLEKKSGIHAEVVLAAPRSNLKVHKKSVAKAEADAEQGKVGVTIPAAFDVVYEVKNANNERVGSRGRVTIQVTCRVETKADGTLRHTGSLLSLDVKPKGVKQ